MITRAIVLGCTVVSVACFDLDSLRESDVVSVDGGGVPAFQDASALPESGVTPLPDVGRADAGPPSTVDAALAPDAGLPSSCGVVGSSCCQPENSCTEGVCLRGVCSAFGGLHAATDGCGANCTIRNSFTAGCSCPFGFVERPVGVRVRSCDGSMVESGSLSLCFPPSLPSAADVRAFFLEADCDGECMAPHPETGVCDCPAGTVNRSAVVGAAGSCVGDRALLTFCEQSDRASATWAGLWQQSAGQCSQPNHLTGICSCPPGSTDQAVELPPMTFHLCFW